MKVSVNSPVIIGLSAISVLSVIIDQYLIVNFNEYVGLSSEFDWNLYTYITSVFAHADWNHVMGNLTIMLLIGPMVEWKYGGKKLLILMLITSLFTGILNKIFFDSIMTLGASGIVFMLMVLSSFANSKKGTIPLTFILVFIFFIGKEIIMSYQSDNISQFSHIVGGIAGGVAGFLIKANKNKGIIL